MKTYFATLILSALTTFLVTPFVRRLAFRFGAVDEPSERKVHRGIIPRLGGLGIYLGAMLPIFFIYFLDNDITQNLGEKTQLLVALFTAATIILGLGIYDDFKEAKPSLKLVFQMAVALLLFFSGFEIRSLNIPGGNEIELPFPMRLVLTSLWIVGITNAINLLDGIDGLVTGVTAFISLALAIINLVALHDKFIAILTLALAGACIGFLPYNFSPARIFLGDSGSLLIGVFLACIGVQSLFKTSTENSGLLIIPMILFGLPLFDTTSVMITRASKGRSIFEADKNHVHHRLLRKGLSQKQASYLLYIVSATLSFVAVLFTWRQTKEIIMGGVCVVIAVVLWLLWAWNMRKRAH